MKIIKYQLIFISLHRFFLFFATVVLIHLTAAAGEAGSETLSSQNSIARKSIGKKLKNEQLKNPVVIARETAASSRSGMKTHVSSGSTNSCRRR